MKVTTHNLTAAGVLRVDRRSTPQLVQITLVSPAIDVIQFPRRVRLKDINFATLLASEVSMIVDSIDPAAGIAAPNWDAGLQQGLRTFRVGAGVTFNCPLPDLETFGIVLQCAAGTTTISICFEFL